MGQLQPLASEQVILAAPLSFTGSTRRIWRHWHPPVLASSGWAKAGRGALLWALLAGAWLGVLLWYALLAFLGLVPLIALVVYRLMRRAQRRGERDRLRHEELLRHLPAA